MSGAMIAIPIVLSILAYLAVGACVGGLWRKTYVTKPADGVDDFFTVLVSLFWPPFGIYVGMLLIARQVSGENRS